MTPEQEVQIRKAACDFRKLIGDAPKTTPEVLLEALDRLRAAQALGGGTLHNVATGAQRRELTEQEMQTLVGTRKDLPPGRREQLAYAVAGREPRVPYSQQPTAETQRVEPQDVVRAMCMTAVLSAWVGPVCAAECARSVFGLIRMGEDPGTTLREMIQHRIYRYGTYGDRWGNLSISNGRRLAEQATAAWTTGTVRASADEGAPE